MNEYPSKRFIFFSVASVVLLLIGIVGAFNMFEENTAGYYQVKQAFLTGDMTVRTLPGVYNQYLGSIETYRLAATVVHSNAEEDLEQYGNIAGPVEVRFPDGTAFTDLVYTYEIDLTDKDKLIELHQKYHSDEGVRQMIDAQVMEAVKNTGTLMNSGDAYSDRKAQFIRWGKEQSLVGLYEADTYIETRVEGTGKAIEEVNEKQYKVKIDKEGRPMIAKASLLAYYGITLPQFNIKDFEFDNTTTELISARKDAQKAKQDAITAQAKGEANIATERAIQEVEKIKEVTKAEKKMAVDVIAARKQYEEEKYAALKALETAKKIEAEGRANAAANLALVKAGLMLAPYTSNCISKVI